MSSKLSASRIYRGGLTARQLEQESSDIKLAAELADNAVRFSFDMGSKGGGRTLVWLEVGPGDFSTLLKAMATVDRQAAMHAMANELAEQIAQQPAKDEAMAAQARRAVQDLAEQKYNEAPAGNDTAEKFVLEHVQRLTKELEEEAVKGAEEGDEEAA